MKVLFLGMGSIGQRHLRNLLEVVPEAQVSAVRRHHGVPFLSRENTPIRGIEVSDYYGIREYRELDNAMADGQDIVFITNPNHMHLDAARIALQHNTHVFLEKPVSHTLEGVDELLALEQKAGGNRVFVGYQNRFHPAVQHVRQLLDDNAIGNLINARFVNAEYMPNWHPYEDYRTSYAIRKDMGGGVLLAQIHDFDMLYWLFGLPDLVHSTGGKVSDLEMDVEDSVITLANYRVNDRPISISLTMDFLGWPTRRTIAIVGENGSIECDLVANTVTLANRLTGAINTQTYANFVRNQMFYDEVTQFVEMVTTGCKPSVSLHDGIQSLRIAFAAKQSLASGKSVHLG